MRWTNFLKQVARPFGVLAALLLMLLIMSDAYAADAGVSFFTVQAVEAELDTTNSVATADIDSDGDLGVLGADQLSPNHRIIYVDDSASGDKDGSSWADAYTDLQEALDAATDGHEIWVAAGTYKPGSERNDTFELTDGVEIYGGFDGTETAGEERDWEANRTILSGDLSGDDNDNVAYDDPTRAENSYHVVTSYDIDAHLDGFTITGGNANDLDDRSVHGGGMRNDFSLTTLKNMRFMNNSAIYCGGIGNLNGSDLRLTNVTFTGNSAEHGGGMCNLYGSHSTLIDVTFSNNSALSDGGGIFNLSSHPTLSDVSFTGNSAHDGGGIYNLDSHPTLSHVRFTGNSAAYGGGMYNSHSDPTLSHVTFTGNLASGDGGGMGNNTSRPTLSLVTFSGNFASDDGGAIANRNRSRPTVANSIIWNNKDRSGTSATSQIYDEGSTTDVTYSLVQGEWSGMGNLNVDPLFVSPINPSEAPTTAGDFHLQPNSPAIDAGDNSAVPNDTLDLDNDGDITEPVPFDLDGGSRFRDTPLDDTGHGGAPIVDMGAYEKGITIYVNKNATGANDGTSWTDAYTDLQAGLTAATIGDEIWVAADTYKPTDGTNRDASFELKEGVAIYGGFAGDETSRQARDWEANSTILSGDIGTQDEKRDNSYHVVLAIEVDRTAILDGFTIRQGNADGDNGGGMRNEDSSPTLNNLLITENKAVHGAGMANLSGSHPLLTNVTFSGNVATNRGGGMYNTQQSHPTIHETKFSNNRAEKGGGMYNRKQSPPILSDVTFVNNEATAKGGAIFNADSDPTMRRVIFTNNSANEAGGGIFNRDSAPTMASATFSGNSAGSDSGGAIFNKRSRPAFSNLLMTGNSAGADGGGMYNESSHPTASNVTASGNLASGRGGGIFNISSVLTISNSILWNNQDNSGPDNNSHTAQLYNSTSTAANVTYSLVQGGSISGTGNISADPLFSSPISPTQAPIAEGDFHLQADSPAIDAGDNGAVLADLADLDGDLNRSEPLPLDLDALPRFQQMPVDDTGQGTPPLVDMGAYEAMSLDDSRLLISEVAWAGSQVNPDDEWIELYNNSNQPINLSGWTLSIGESAVITLAGSIDAQGYYLMEHDDDQTISDIAADLIYTGALDDGGEILTVRDHLGQVVDTANHDGGSWPAGNEADTNYNSALQFSTMERISSTMDMDSSWATNDTHTRHGQDANAQPLNGTPRAANSIMQAEADDHCSGATEITLTNNLSEPHTSLLRDHRDVDFFKFDVPDEYTTIVATLSQPADFDFRLQGTCNHTIGDDYYNLGQPGETSQSVIRFDVGGQPGTFYLKVSAPPGSYSGQPYQLELELRPANVSNVKTLIFYNHMRFATGFGIEAASQTMDQLTHLAQNANVQGTMIQLDRYPEVQAAYEVWDSTPISPTMPNVEAANAVADAIREVMRENLDIDKFPRTEYIVLVGDDDQIPFRRIDVNPPSSAADPSWVYESDYPLNSANSPIGAALQANQTLTDDLYGDYVIRPWQVDRHLYLPELAVGRLLDTPARIQSMIEAFLEQNGEISVERAAVAGHGFLSDAASAQCQSLSDAGLTCNGIINQDYSADILKNNFLTSTIDLVSNNWHANHTAFQAPGPAPDGSELHAQAIISSTSNLRGQVWWSVGCQAGLAMPTDDQYQLSLAQALSTHGVTYVGNTGWGWGGGDALVLSEQLYQLLTNKLTQNPNIALPIGDALRKAKRQYYHESLLNFSYYDEKVMTEATLFGFPMLRVRLPDQPDGSQRLRAELATKEEKQIVTVNPEALRASDWITPTGQLRFDSSIPGAFHPVTIALGNLNQIPTQTENGMYYMSPEGEMAAAPGHPILPQDEHFDFGSSLGQGHGVIWLAGDYNEQNSYNPVINSVADLNSAPSGEMAFDGLYPRIPVALSTIESRDPADPFSNRLLFTTGQFEGSHEGGRLRLFTDISFLVGLSTNEDDLTPPELGQLSSSYDGQTLDLSLPISDSSGIYKALVTYTETNNPTGSGSWRSRELSANNGIYSLTLPITTSVTYFLQAMDHAGNVSTLLPESGYFATATSHAMNMQIGWNYLAWPLAPVEPKSAAELCDQINNQGGEVSEIDRWHNGGWQGHICGLPFNDFELATGKGYFIKSHSASRWRLAGTPINNPAPLPLQIGWNAISIPHTNAYTASSLCNDIINQGVTAIEIDRWHSGGWQGHQCGLPFSDFQIEPATGYLVKANSPGTVTPTQP